MNQSTMAVGLAVAGCLNMLRCFDAGVAQAFPQSQVINHPMPEQIKALLDDELKTTTTSLSLRP